MTVRFHEVDRAGILFFGRVFEYCHAAYEELLLAIDCGIDALIERERVGMPLVHSEADFLQPIRMHERIDVELEVVRLGERSITFGYSLRGADGVVRARAKLVHAFVSFDGFASVPAPAALLDGLRREGLVS